MSNMVKVAKVGAVQAIVVAIIAGVFGIGGAALQLAIKKPATESKLIETFDLRLPVGTVVSSVIHPRLFSRMAGDPGGFDPRTSVWIPADGREVPGSRYAKAVTTTIPDLRGLFLRGLNKSEDDRIRDDVFADPEGANRRAGEPQRSATALPRTPFTGGTVSGGDHKHDFDGARSYNAGAGGHDRAKSSGMIRQTKPAGAHTHPVNLTEGGDLETRPSNAAVFFYIKIN